MKQQKKTGNNSSKGAERTNRLTLKKKKGEKERKMGGE